MVYCSCLCVFLRDQYYKLLSANKGYKLWEFIIEALRDPISVSMLKIDGKGIMDVTHVTPGPKIGSVLHALLEEVLEDPKLNNKEYLESRAKELIVLPEKELEILGKQGKSKLEEVESENIEEIHKKYHVS